MSSTKNNVNNEPKAIEAAWAQTGAEIARTLGTDPADGLSEAEATRRLAKYGPNQLAAPERLGIGRIIARQFASVVILLLIVAAIASAIFGDIIDAAAIGVVVLINAAIGTWMEYSATQSMESLRKLGGVHATVVRDSEPQRIDAVDFVPGDVVTVTAGDVVGADVRLLEATRLSVDESALTGESLPVWKSEDVLDRETSLGDRRNMLSRGTAVATGEGRGIVVATGMRTQMGRVADLAGGIGSERTPLERRLDELGRRLAAVAFGLSVVIAIAALLAGRSFEIVLETGVALAVATVPEGLPIVATIALAHGMWQLAKRNALVKNLSAVETLGSTTTICVDKTGTLTHNELQVEAVRAVSEERHRELLQISTLCNGASLANGGSGVGDPLEIALLRRAAEEDMAREDLLSQMPEIRREPFDADTRMMATFHDAGDDVYVAVKGAPEAVVEHCGPEARDWLAVAEEMAVDGLRVLAMASKVVPSSEADPYGDLELVGLVGLADPPREDAREAVEACRIAGIRVVMITGDHPETAGAIARRVGIGPAEGELKITTGRELDNTDVGDVDVFARVEPAQKLQIVQQLRKAGHIVSMTGDGVNDAPALVASDIGVAMGLRGTDVAREAADIVLRDDALSSIVAAVRQGRTIFDNIRKFVFYLLSCNASELFVVAIAFVAMPNLPMPITALQILFLNLVTDVFPALALGVSEPSLDAMTRAPRRPGRPFMEARDWATVGGFGLLLAFATLGAFYIVLDRTGDGDKAVTVAFLALALSQLFHVFNTAAPKPMKGRIRAILNTEVSRNPWVWGAIALCLILLIVPMYVPPIAEILSLTPIGAPEVAVVVVAALLPASVGAFLRFVGFESPSAKRTSALTQRLPDLDR